MDKNRQCIVLEMKNITKIFPGVKALSDAQLILRKGEVHALVGENGAGKSTLMNVLLGIYQRDGGEIIYMGKPVEFKIPSAALNAGITMIHQEISMMPNMTIAENVWIGRENFFRKGLFINKKAMNEKTAQLFRESLEIDVDPQQRAKDLSIAQLQLVELCRAVSYHAEIIIMDEPTSALTDSEVALLYKIIRKLTAKGVSIVFISHKLEEIFEICNRITVMRDGKFIQTCDTSEIDKNHLIELIAGRALTTMYSKDHVEIGQPVLRVENATRYGEFSDVTFEVRKGEVLGFCGLIGAGRTEIMQSIFGMTALDEGKIFLNGKEVRINSPETAIKNGIGLVTEDRLRQGTIGKLSVQFNMTLSNLFRYTCCGFVKNHLEQQESDSMIRKMKVKISGKRQVIAQLSGGNQQKVIIGRSLLTKPDVLILDEPTRGIDVGSKSEIYKIINQLAKEGMSVLMVSSETPELLGTCDRILVVSGGKIVGEFDPKVATQADLMHAAFSAVS